MRTFLWIAASLFTLFIYACGAVARFHSTPKMSTPKQKAAVAVAAMTAWGTWIGWAAETVSFQFSAQAPAAVLGGGVLAIGLTVLAFAGYGHDLQYARWAAAGIWPIVPIGTFIVSLAMGAWPLVLATSQGMEALGSALATLSPTHRAEVRNAERADRERRIAELEDELGMR